MDSALLLSDDQVLRTRGGKPKGLRPQLTTTASKNPPCDPVTGRPRRGQPAERRTSASLPLRLPPTTLLWAAAAGRAAGRQMGRGDRRLQRSCQPFPGDGGNAAGVEKGMGFPRSLLVVSPSGSRPPLSPPSPHARADGERSPHRG